EPASAQKDLDATRSDAATAAAPVAAAGPVALGAGWLGHDILAHPANAGVHALAMRRAQQAYGNRHVQRMVTGLHSASTSARVVQPKCDCGGTCPKCQSADVDDHHLIQPSSGGAGQSGPPHEVDLFPAGGEPLTSSTRRFMEARFATSFSDVRVHTDSP